MDAVNTNSVPQQTAALQAVAAPAAPVVMESTPQYVAPPQQPMPQQGTPNKNLDFFKDINWFEVTFMFLGALALIKTIDYYSYKKKEDKTTYYDIQRQIDTLQIITMMEGNAAVQPIM